MPELAVNLSAGFVPKGLKESASGRFVSNFYDNTVGPLVELGKQAYSELKDPANKTQITPQGKGWRITRPDPNRETLGERVGEGIVQSHKDEASAAKTAWNEGHYSEAAGHALATAVPLVGPPAAHAGTIMGQGDIAGGLGAGTGLITSVVLPAKIAKLRAGAQTAEVASDTSRVAKTTTKPATSIESSPKFVKRYGTPDEVLLSPEDKGLSNQNVAPKQRGPQLVSDPEVEVSPGTKVRASKISRTGNDPAAYGSTEGAPVEQTRSRFNTRKLPEGFSTASSEFNNGRMTEVIGPKGKGVGFVTVEPTDIKGQARISASELASDLHNRGIGKSAYTTAFDDAFNNGFTSVRSDIISLSNQAEHTWQSLSREYHITRTPDGGYEMLLENVGKPPTNIPKLQPPAMPHYTSFLEDVMKERAAKRVKIPEPERAPLRPESPAEPSFIENTIKMTDKKLDEIRAKEFWDKVNRGEVPED